MFTLSWIIWPQMEEIVLDRAETAGNNKNQPRYFKFPLVKVLVSKIAYENF